MPLHPTSAAPERILTFGPAGTSKTTGLLNIARFAQRTHSDARFFILDSDFAIDRMLVGYPELPVATYGQDGKDARVIVYPCFEWPDYERALKDVHLRARSGDWVMVDFISNAWYAVQEHYVNEVFHQDLGAYFLKVRKDMDKGQKTLDAFEGWVDWQVINPLYKRWANTLLYRGRYHLYCTAKSTTLSSDRRPTEDRQTRELFSRYQTKPVGQKDLPFQFHTVLLTGRREDQWTLTTIKDRERVEVSSLPVTNFAIDYLVDVAGWSL